MSSAGLPRREAPPTAWAKHRPHAKAIARTVVLLTLEDCLDAMKIVVGVQGNGLALFWREGRYAQPTTDQLRLGFAPAPTQPGDVAARAEWNQHLPGPFAPAKGE